MTSSTSRRGRRPDEFALIAELFAPLATARGALSLTDDAALLTPPRGHELVVTADAIVEGVHFLKDDSPASVARKALGVNVSDLAAKGAVPLGYLMALSLPAHIDHAWLRAFARGLAQGQKAFRLVLLGGDTTATPGALTIAITAIGSVPRGRMIQRRGAKPGDVVCVSGTIGDAGAGLSCLKRKKRSGAAARLVARYRIPEPRLSLGRRLVGIAHAAIDISDGLLADLGHIAETSKARIAVDASRIPLSTPFRTIVGSDTAAVIRAATSGDDYEIAFTCSAAKVRRLRAIARAAGVCVTEIGRVERGRGVVLLDDRGKPLKVARRGWQHF